MVKRFALVLLVAAALVVAYTIMRPPPAPGEWIEGSGVIEATEVDVAPLVSGRIITVAAAEGARVTAGDVVAEIEHEELAANLQGAEGALQAARAELARAEALLSGSALTRDNARLAYDKRTELTGRYQAAKAQHEAALAARDQAKAKLDLVRAGTRGEQIEQARAAAASAETNWANAERELVRLERLLAEGAVAQQQVDLQRTARDSARAALDQARARLAEAEAGARAEEERQAEAALAQAEANVRGAARGLATAEELYRDRLALKQETDAAEAQYRAAAEAKAAAEAQVEAAEAARAAAAKKLADATVRAPMDGVVVLKIREPGETVAAGQPILRLADLDHMWLRVYVPETELPRVKLGQAAEVTTDADPGKVYEGRVTEISQQAEFTPKNVQTREQRVKLVFGVKVSVENPKQELKPGMPGDARIRVGKRD